MNSNNNSEHNEKIINTCNEMIETLEEDYPESKELMSIAIKNLCAFMINK